MTNKILKKMISIFEKDLTNILGEDLKMEALSIMDDFIETKTNPHSLLPQSKIQNVKKEVIILDIDSMEIQTSAQSPTYSKGRSDEKDHDIVMVEDDSPISPKEKTLQKLIFQSSDSHRIWKADITNQGASETRQISPNYNMTTTKYGKKRIFKNGSPFKSTRFRRSKKTPFIDLAQDRRDNSIEEVTVEE